MTQLTLGVDRDAGGRLRDDVRRARRCSQGDAGDGDRGVPRRGSYVGICGQGPSDHPDLAQWLVEQGIEQHVAQSRHRRCDVDDAREAGGTGRARKKRRPSRNSADAPRPNGRSRFAGSRFHCVHAMAAARSRRARVIDHCDGARSRHWRVATCAVIATLPFEPVVLGLATIVVVVWALDRIYVVALEAGAARGTTVRAARRPDGGHRHRRWRAYAPGAYIATVTSARDSRRSSGGPSVAGGRARSCCCPTCCRRQDFRRLRVLLRYGRSEVTQGNSASQA